MHSLVLLSLPGLVFAIIDSILAGGSRSASSSGIFVSLLPMQCMDVNASFGAKLEHCSSNKSAGSGVGWMELSLLESRFSN